MDRQFQCFAYLLESYALHKHIATADALALWDEHGITDFIYDMYQMYHQEVLQNAFIDIDSLITTGRPAWLTASPCSRAF